jgi:hypothetical protein
MGAGKLHLDILPPPEGKVRGVEVKLCTTPTPAESFHLYENIYKKRNAIVDLTILCLDY